MNVIIKDEVDESLQMPTFSIVPLSNWVGMFEWVENTTTFLDIIKKENKIKNLDILQIAI